MIELTDQDLQDIRFAIEAATVQGPISEMRKVIIRYTIISKKIEDMLNERAANRVPQEHEGGAPDNLPIIPDIADGNVGGGHVRKRKHSRQAL